MLKSASVNFNPGDKVRVKDGVIDPDFKFDIGGWSGEVIDSFPGDESKRLCLIKWNNETISRMGRNLIRKCEDQDYDYSQMYLEVSEIEFSTNLK